MAHAHANVAATIRGDIAGLHRIESGSSHAIVACIGSFRCGCGEAFTLTGDGVVALCRQRTIVGRTREICIHGDGGMFHLSSVRFSSFNLHDGLGMKSIDGLRQYAVDWLILRGRSRYPKELRSADEKFNPQQR